MLVGHHSAALALDPLAHLGRAKKAHRRWKFTLAIRRLASTKFSSAPWPKTKPHKLGRQSSEPGTAHMHMALSLGPAGQLIYAHLASTLA